MMPPHARGPKPDLHPLHLISTRLVSPHLLGNIPKVTPPPPPGTQQTRDMQTRGRMIRKMTRKRPVGMHVHKLIL